MAQPTISGYTIGERLGSGGFASVYLALSRPEAVGNVALQSFYFREEAEEELRTLIADFPNSKLLDQAYYRLGRFNEAAGGFQADRRR